MIPSQLYLWNRRTLYIGRHRFFWAGVDSAASILVLALGPELNLHLEGTPYSIKSRSVLVPAGCKISGYANGPFASLFLDPFLQNDLQPLKKIMRHSVGNVWYDSNIEQQQLAGIRAIQNQQCGPAKAYDLLCNEVLMPCHQHSANKSIDGRIQLVIDLLKTDHMDNTSNEILAQKVGLSSSRLQRLFKQATGIPIRRYRLWHRLFVASTLIGFGKSFTDAAVEAGFFDSSHFNHTFQRMLGPNPSAILKGDNRITIRLGGEN